MSHDRRRRARSEAIDASSSGNAAVAGDATLDLNETVAAAQSGCPDAFNDLVSATYGDTFALALRLVGNPEDARDVVQDTYLRAYRAIPRFRGDAAIGTWLFRITSNCAHNLIRRFRPTEPLGEDNAPVDTDMTRDPATAAEGSELRARVVAALAQLPAKLREVVELRELADLSHDAIAKRLGITETAAKVRLHRARAKLRELLFRSDESGEPGVISARTGARGRAAAHDRGQGRPVADPTGGQPSDDCHSVRSVA
jgi:RNA polymerase sigma-70 factor, ECF subfamily